MTLKKKIAFLFLRIVFIIVIAIITFAAGFLTWLTIVEWKPLPIEPAEPIREGFNDKLCEGETITVFSWNVGYAALDANSDFFMDGGTMVQPKSKIVMLENM